MNNNRKLEIADRVGMVYSGLNADGELEFIGTEAQWNEFDKLLNEEPTDEPIDDVERYEAQAEQDKRLNDESKYPNE